MNKLELKMRRSNPRELLYQTGFAKDFSTEATPGTLSIGRSQLSRAPFGLCAEELTSAAYPESSRDRRRSWLYRLRPSAVHRPFQRFDNGSIASNFCGFDERAKLMTWPPLALPSKPTDFLSGWVTLAGFGSARERNGSALHLYVCNKDMSGRYFFNADGELLIGPRKGRLMLLTELGNIAVDSFEIAVIPRGVRFQVALPDGAAQGYIWENYGMPLRLPEPDPSGLLSAPNPNHFLVPHAAYDNTQGDFTLLAKYEGDMWSTPIGRSPFDVVAWRGNCAPYKYDLRSLHPSSVVEGNIVQPKMSLLLQALGRDSQHLKQEFFVSPTHMSSAQGIPLCSSSYSSKVRTGLKTIIAAGDTISTIGLFPTKLANNL